MGIPNSSEFISNTIQVNAPIKAITILDHIIISHLILADKAGLSVSL